MSGAPLHADVRFWRDESLPGVEARFSSYTHKAFRTHTHQHCLVSLIEAGSTCFSLGRASHLAHRRVAQAVEQVLAQVAAIEGGVYASMDRAAA